MPDPTNHQTPQPTSSPSSSPGPIAQQLVQGAGQTSPNSPQPTSIQGKAPGKKKGKPWKEVREWLNVIIGALLIPLLIVALTINNNNQTQRQHDSDQHIAQQNRQADVANQLDQQRETALKTYEDDISNLLLDRHLATSQPGDEVRIVALAKTLEALHQLDGPRNDRAIQFLQDAQLIGADLTTKSTYTIINFSSVDLANDDLSEANLSWTNLSGAILSKVILSEAILVGATLSEANLSGANLNGANLVAAKLNGANLSEANLNGANLIKANLSGANVSGANLSGADLSGTIMPNGTRHSCQRGEESFCP